MLPITNILANKNFQYWTPHYQEEVNNYTDSKINQYLVIHWTASVMKAIEYEVYYNVYIGTSAHYFVDDTSICHAIKDEYIAYHCATGGKYLEYNTKTKCRNGNSIGIEMCCKKDGDGLLYIPEETKAHTAELVQFLMGKYGIPSNNVIRHYDVTFKPCPGDGYSPGDDNYTGDTKWKELHKQLTGATPQEDKEKKITQISEEDTEAHKAHLAEATRLSNSPMAKREAIKDGNIKVSTIPFTKILDVKITQGVNEHAAAYVKGEVDKEIAAEIIKKANTSVGLSIETTAKEQVPKLFYGCVDRIERSQGEEEESAYAIIEVYLLSTSTRIDAIKRNRSFQNTESMHEDIINSVVEGHAEVYMMVEDKPIGEGMMQYNETGWEFAKRIASKFNAPLITNVLTDKPIIFVGFSSAKKERDMEPITFGYSKDCYGFEVINQNEMDGEMTMTAYSTVHLSSHEYGYIGDFVQVHGVKYRIATADSKMEKGVLVNTYKLTGGSGEPQGMPTSDEEASASGGAGDEDILGGYAQSKKQNVQASGRMFTGKVKKVEYDKVQVHIEEIDEAYDGESTQWFPFSTPYSSTDGSGWYAMPEVDDTVRVFFPTDKEKDAFATSSISQSPLGEPRNTSWRAPGGKEILLTNDGIYILCAADKVFISLIEERGIVMYSDKDLTIAAKQNINIQGSGEILVRADKEIKVGTPDAYIHICSDAITIAGEQVLLN